MEKIFVVQKVATQLWATENAVDSAMSEASAMMADMLQARRDLGLSAVVADGAFTKLVAAISALGEARAAMVAVHGELDSTRLRIGVRTKLAGYEDKGNLADQSAPSTMRVAS